MPLRPSNYQLEASVGSDLADWNHAYLFLFPPVTLRSRVRFLESCNKTSSAQLVVGEVPALCPFHCAGRILRLGGVLSVTSAVSTPYGLDTTAHPSVTAPIQPPHSAHRWLHIFGEPKCGHQQFRRVFPERWMLPSRVRGEQPMRSHRCGARD